MKLIIQVNDGLIISSLILYKPSSLPSLSLTPPFSVPHLPPYHITSPRLPVSLSPLSQMSPSAGFPSLPFHYLLNGMSIQN